jgi:hypothetical protein
LASESLQDQVLLWPLPQVKEDELPALTQTLTTIITEQVGPLSPWSRLNREQLLWFSPSAGAMFCA